MFGVAILVACGVFLAWLYYEPSDEEPQVACCVLDRTLNPSLSHVGRWLVALSGPLALVRGDGFRALGVEHSTECLLETVSGSWSFDDAESTRQTLEWLLDEGHQQVLSELRSGEREAEGEREERFLREFPGARRIHGYDLVRVSCVARWAYSVGYLEAEEAFDWIRRAGREAQAEFSSWEELRDNFMLGRQLWGGPPDPEYLDLFLAVFDAKNPRCVTRGLDWSLDLSAPALS